ncbi:substrate-binding domain-containing protein [Actinomadura opuntiae]|uniref:substrate-binding domain-containing protein n=1 Tax=Actinomadura sp. OS1-43 TaxID=604315 RepID=UPI00255AF447|nr:substrate-binding domain-containing protein [Actinomadura sp. OS1-43]MDL4820721.1 substrate-binding domain-containing protein [Actinomadura sp. OS1-43]
MSGHDDDVPDWAPRSLSDSGAYPVPRDFLGASDPGGAARARRRPQAGPPGEPPSPPPSPRAGGPAHAAARSRGRGHGGHEAARPPRRHPGIMLGPLAAAVGLVLLLGFGVYALASSGGGCSGGDAVTVSVAAAPDIEPAVAKAAERFNDARHEVGGRCARVRVGAADPAAVTTLLSGKGSTGVTERPDVWIPDSSLWISLVQGTERPGKAVPFTGLGGIAASPIVVAMPKTLAGQLRDAGVPARPSWRDLLEAAGTADETGGSPAAGTGGPLPPHLLRLQVPDPDRSATGMGTLMLAGALLGGSPDGQAVFTGVVRTIREGVAASVNAEFTAFRGEADQPYPVAIAPERAVYAYNAGRPADPAVAVYPAEGSAFLDYPVTALTKDPAKLRACRLFRKALASKDSRALVHGLGLRTPDGAAPASFTAQAGVDPRAPHALAAPPAATVAQTMQAWAQLSLSIRMLSIVDISGSMGEQVEPGVTRLQSTIRTAQGGLSLLPDDSELGQWEFSTDLPGGRDWRELVGVGPLGERLGSSTRRQQVLSAFAQMRVKAHGDTGLYDTVLAAFDYMTRTYKPEFVNSILLWTDGRDEDPDGPTLDETLAELRRVYDPERPVQVNMVGYGPDVDVRDLRRVAHATRGEVYVAETPEQIQGIFLRAVSRRVCEPGC